MWNIKMITGLMIGLLLSMQCYAETVLLTGVVRYAEKLTVTGEPQMRYVVEVDESAHETWSRKYADVRVKVTDIGSPLLFKKGDFLIVSGRSDDSDVDILHSSLVHKTDAVEMTNDDLLPIWMAYYRERLQADLQYALDNFESTTIETIYPIRFLIRMSRDHQTYTFIEYNRLKDHPLMPLIEFQMKRTISGMDTLVPEIFFDFFQISIKDMIIIVEKHRRSIS